MLKHYVASALRAWRHAPWATVVIVLILALGLVGYVAARAYLRVFIQPIELTALPFVASLALTLLVACLAVARQTWSAARLKPASVLRHE